MYLTETDQTLSKEQVQSNLITSAVAFLASQCDGSHENDKAGFNKVDSEFGHSLAQIIKQAGSLSFGQEYAAWKMCRKYWRQLRKAEPEIILPKKWVSTYKVDVGTGGSSKLLVWNLSKGSGPYTLELIGDDELSCTCEAYQSGNTCGHIDAAVRLGYLGKLDAEPTSKPLEGELIPFDMGGAPIVTDEDITESETDTEQPYEMLPGVYANDDQLNALNNLKKFAYGESIMYLLTGYAGSGKTTLVQAWLRDLRAEGYSGRIVFTAPTNKAAGVLRSMVNQWGLDVECITCAKLLGLKPKIDFETGKQLFVKDYNAESVIQEYDLVVVDESSMVSEDLWGYLAEEANMFTRILYMGDPAQLPPVNEAISKVFMEVTNKSHLSKVMRYRGSIAAMADEIRSNLGRKSEPCFESQYSEDGSEGLFLLPDKSWYQALIKLFSSDNYVEDPNYCRALAYTNKRVNSINTFVRNEIRGVDSPRFVAGERLIATEHYSIPDIYGGHGRSVILANSAECEVIDAVRRHGRTLESMVFNCCSI